MKVLHYDAASDDTIKASLILLFALAHALLRRRSAAIRHLVLSAAVLCAVALPAVEWVVPSWHLGLGTSSWCG